MNSGSASVCNILDIPDEILAKIILPFNARERLTLTKSCTRFYSLVFGDEELLRDLDFSKNGCLTTETDIQEYFSKETTCKLVRKINIQNVRCMKAGHMLNNSIGRAINLVDINILGTQFKDIEQLGSFLEPLVQLKRLSVDWPKPAKRTVEVSSTVIEKPFSRLKYLSVTVCPNTKEFLSTVKLCQKLEELRMVTLKHGFARGVSLSTEPEKLRNLKIIQFRGNAPSGPLLNDLMDMVPDPSEWTEFYLVEPYTSSYLEKNLEVCDELEKVKFVSPDYRSLYPYGTYNENLGWPVISECLLNKVIRVTHEDVPEKFCCLDIAGRAECQLCLMKIDEAKQLLKDPRYQISYLHFKHSIEPDCDAHLVVSAFPNLTELVLCHLSKKKDRRKKKNFRRRLRIRGSKEPVEPDDPKNPDSSFRMLVENTPHLKDLTISSIYIYEEGARWWDFDALYLIAHWKNLTAIRLRNIPITDGKFLIDIGKECPKLEEVQLFNLGSKTPCCYTNELLQMLGHCRNLMKFSICQRSIENMSEMFRTLSNNSKLRTVRLMTKTEEYETPELVSSIEQVLHRCPELTKFVFVVQSAHNRVRDELRPALQRIIDELNRPNFQFCGLTSSGPSNVFEDASTSFFPTPSDDRQFAYY